MSIRSTNASSTLTPYLSLYKTSAKALVDRMRAAVYEETGITATAGIGPNLFLAKVALDITAKHCEDGIGVLDEAELQAAYLASPSHHRYLADRHAVSLRGSRALAFAILKGWPTLISICSTESSA